MQLHRNLFEINKELQSKFLLFPFSNEDLYFLNPNLGTEEQNHEVDDLFSDLNSEGKSVVNWEKPPENLQNEGVLAKINQERIIKHLSWHFKGDYLSSVATDDILFLNFFFCKNFSYFFLTFIFFYLLPKLLYSFTKFLQKELKIHLENKRTKFKL